MSRKTCYSTGNRITTTQLGTIDFSGHDRAKNQGRRGSFCGRRERAFRGGEREGGRRRTGTSVLTQLVALAVASPSLPTPRSRRQGTPCVRACYAACCAQPHKVSRCATPYNAMAESTLCSVAGHSSPRNRHPSSSCTTKPRAPFVFQGLFIDEGEEEGKTGNSIKVGSTILRFINQLLVGREGWREGLLLHIFIKRGGNKIGENLIEYDLRMPDFFLKQS